MTSWLQLLGAAAQLLLAVVFVISALSKVHSPADLTRTIKRLGVPVNALVVIAAEALTGAALLLAPANPLPRLMVVLLAVAFAIAGVLALARGERIECSCFGSGKGSPLGWRQIGLLPVWLALAATAQSWHPGWGVHLGLLGLAGAATGLLVWRIPALSRTVRDVRLDRVALGDLERDWRITEGIEP